jgi:hypothetical protein
VRHRHARRLRAPGLRRQRPPRHIRPLHGAQQARLRTAVTVVVRGGNRRRDLPPRGMGRPARDAVADLRHDDQGRPCGLGPCRHLCRPRPGF